MLICKVLAPSNGVIVISVPGVVSIKIKKVGGHITFVVPRIYIHRINRNIKFVS